MTRVVLLTLALCLALCAVLALTWEANQGSNQGSQDAAPLHATRPSTDPEPETLADGPDGPRLESGVSLERRLAQRAARLGLLRSDGPPTKLETLAKTPGWTRFLQLWLLLPPEQDPAAQLARLEQTLTLAMDPVVRQNLIFLVGLALPQELVAPWLATLRTGSDPADAEDALVALAMRGDPAALAAFESLADTPSSVEARQLIDHHEVHDALGASSTLEARERLRSYRAIEVRLGEPYFKLTAYLASRQWGGGKYGEVLHWQPPAALERTIEERLLKAWLERYPGHPGSDNVALWLARLSAQHGDHLEAARWCARAAVWPDQDMSYGAQVQLMGICELRLTPEQVHGLSTEEGLSTPNRIYYTYVWLRRLAAERGPEQGVRAWAVAAAQDPDSDLGVAWSRRSASPAPIGLDSGLAPLPSDDPLHRLDTQAPPWPGLKNPNVGVYGPYGPSSGRYRGATTRLHPWPEPMLLDRARLERQVRAWETLAELERRAERAQHDALAELLYKQAAVLYHDHDAYYPAYCGHSLRLRLNLGSAPSEARSANERQAVRAQGEHFERTSFAWLRSLALFERIERDHPRWAGSDRVLYSQALSWRRLVDYRPHYAWTAEPGTGRDGRRAEAAQRTVACFERLISLYPESPLVPDARAAVAWWRRQRADMLR